MCGRQCANPVTVGTQPIIGVQWQVIEEAGIRDARGVEGRLATQFYHADHRQFLAHASALRRVVVGECDGFESQAQILGNDAQVGSLVEPICSKHRKMLLS